MGGTQVVQFNRGLRRNRASRIAGHHPEGIQSCCISARHQSAIIGRLPEAPSPRANGQRIGLPIANGGGWNGILAILQIVVLIGTGDTPDANTVKPDVIVRIKRGKIQPDRHTLRGGGNNHLLPVPTPTRVVDSLILPRVSRVKRLPGAVIERIAKPPTNARSDIVRIRGKAPVLAQSNIDPLQRPTRNSSHSGADANAIHRIAQSTGRVADAGSEINRVSAVCTGASESNDSALINIGAIVDGKCPRATDWIHIDHKIIDDPCG